LDKLIVNTLTRCQDA